MKKKIAGGAFFALLIAMAGTFSAKAAMSGYWELSDDEKYWMYMYSGYEWAQDEWIEDQGKTYYLDSKGRMKTGWVANKDDKKKYYMGPDGAMCFNMFAPDGKYVGPNGWNLDQYDKYRKAVRSEIKKSAPGKSSGRNKNTAEDQSQQFFLLSDLNGDGYKDLIVMYGEQQAESLREIAVWIPEDGKFQLAAEFDKPEKGDYCTLYLDPEGDEVWMEMTEKSGEMNLFQMEYGSAVMENVWSFTMETDEAGNGRYYINGSEEDREVWELFMARAREQRGNQPLTGYQPATEDNIAAQADRVLGEGEIELWD
ncbi:MAG: hypothetical protein HFG69_16405 [Hungatella sp.]|nr:hypothetical protein [Hungatella sp.]